MQFLLVEDEVLLATRLEKLLSRLEPGAAIAGKTNSIVSTINWLQSNPAPDLIFMDIELADGQCFEIFNKIKVPAPVIFTTAYDEHALKAFKLNSIDYLLKPIKEEELEAALNKWKENRRTQSTAPDINLILEKRNNHRPKIFRDRFLVKQGQKFLPIDSSDVALFYSRNSVVWLVTTSKSKFVVDFTLDELEADLDPRHFFRANRQFIVSNKIISAVHPWFNGKLRVDTTVAAEEEIVISREKASDLKEWLGG